MKCPCCQEPDTKVVDSRASREGMAIRRRRVCSSCGKRFTTYEQIEEPRWLVIKKDRSREPFDRQKIRAGLEKALYKRPVSPEVIEEIIGRIEAKIFSRAANEVASCEIGEWLMEELQPIDQVAYVRFASVYRAFQDVSDFAEEIRPLMTTNSQ